MALWGQQQKTTHLNPIASKKLENGNVSLAQKRLAFLEHNNASFVSNSFLLILCCRLLIRVVWWGTMTVVAAGLCWLQKYYNFEMLQWQENCLIQKLHMGQGTIKQYFFIALFFNNNTNDMKNQHRMLASYIMKHAWGTHTAVLSDRFIHMVRDVLYPEPTATS